jgi:hypothetical protein
MPVNQPLSVEVMMMLLRIYDRVLEEVEQNLKLDKGVSVWKRTREISAGQAREYFSAVILCHCFRHPFLQLTSRCPVKTRLVASSPVLYTSCSIPQNG